MDDAMPKTRKWTDESIATACKEFSAGKEHFPTNSELRDAGRLDLSNAIARNGGFCSWAKRLGLPRIESDSDTGWAGEEAFKDLAIIGGFAAERMTRVKHPFDIMLGGVLRVDVKSANFATYGKKGGCRGWFYRIGKAPQADVVVLYQLDTKDFYALPWSMVPQTNITISQTGGKYAGYFNNWHLLRDMLATRQDEQKRLTAVPG